MKLLWLDLNSSYAHSSLALPALHAQIADDTTIEWCTVSATINENIGMVVNQIYHHQPDIIAATNWLFNHEQLLHIVSRAKALLPHCCIVLGGPEFLGNNEAFLRKNKFVNGVFRGEGEEVFPIWLKVWNHPVNEWNQISGLCYLDESDQYQDNGIARVMNFSQLVSPEKSRFFNWSKPFVQLETTRGCFNTCAFCVSGGEKPVRTISLEAIRERLNVIHQHGIKNVLVLTPMRKESDSSGPICTDTLNRILRDAVNQAAPGKKEMKIGERIFREGDRVINLKNDTDCVNGDIGTIVKISADGETMTIELDCGSVLDFDKTRVTKAIELAYSVTVHKSQGGEYSAILFPFVRGQEFMLYRQLVYTAITRAKKQFLGIGDIDLLKRAGTHVLGSKQPRDLLDVRIIALAAKKSPLHNGDGENRAA